MRKILLFLLVVGLSNCEVRVKQANAQAKPNWTESEFYRVDPEYPQGTSFKRIVIDSMEFGLFQCLGGHGTGTAFVVNLTKEKLEVELLKKNLKSK